MKPGIYSDLSNAAYHADRSAISKSKLDLLRKSPAHLRYALDNETPATASMQKGKILHKLLLEPTTFDDEYAILPATIKMRRGKAYEEFLLEHPGKEIILPTEIETIAAIVEAVKSNPIADNILQTSIAVEQSIFVEEFETDILCKCRPDIVTNNWIYDLKTTRNANATSFAQSCRQYRYDVQAAFYLDLCRMAGIDVDNFGFIVVDNTTQPYQCTVFHRFTDDVLFNARAEYKDDLRLYAECLESDAWPGYPESYDLLELSGNAYDYGETDDNQPELDNVVSL